VDFLSVPAAIVIMSACVVNASAGDVILSALLVRVAAIVMSMC
jgi:hypothetical protein